MEVSVGNDPELATEVITLLGKELKIARERIRELEAQVQHGNRGESSAEKAEVERLTLENESMGLRVKTEEITEDKFSIPPLERCSSGHDDLANKVNELEEALEAYYSKYKAQKVSKAALRNAVSELETQVKTLTSDNEKLRQAAEQSSKKAISELETQVKTLTSDNEKLRQAAEQNSKLPGPPEFVAFMSKFPQFDGRRRPHYKHLQPVCYRGADIAAYLSSDTNLEKFSNRFVYLPGRLLWCRFDSQHAMAFGPQHLFDAGKSRWELKSVFEGLYEKSFELFFLSRGLVFYGGTYICHNLRSWSPEGSLMPAERVYPDALASATVQNIDSVSDSEQKSLEKLIEQLYIDQVLKVEVMGLQCVGFNAELYEVLDRRFRTSQPVLGKREGSQSEGRSELAKKIRIATS